MAQPAGLPKILFTGLPTGLLEIQGAASETANGTPGVPWARQWKA